MERLQKYFGNPVLQHVLFWIAVYLYFVLSVNNISLYGSYRHIFESYGLIVFAQIIVAYVCIYILMPKFLNRKKTGLFVFWMLMLLVSVFLIYQAFRMFYFDVEYFDSYNDVQKVYAVESYWKRLSYFSVFLSKSILYLTPTALLLWPVFIRTSKSF